jgi:predicted porin
MKHGFVAAAALLSGTAFAQSSVTIYGIVDLSGEYDSGHSKLVEIQSGNNYGSRLGFKGSEDLGGGYFADFVLEGGINVDTGSSGQGGTLFGRQAFGALRTPYGTLSAGRQYSSIYVLTSEFSEFFNSPSGASTAVIGGFAGGYEPVRGSSATAVPPATGASVNGDPGRVNNTLRYTTPSFGGLKASALYGLGEVTGATFKTRLFDGSVRYTAGNVDAMVSYVDDRAAGSTPATSTNVSTASAAAGYTWNAWHVEAGYLMVNDKRPANLDGKGFWVGGDYRVGASTFRVQLVQSRPEHTTVGKTNAFGPGYQYDFSKRTFLYTSVARFQNGGTGLGRFDGPIPAGLTVANDKNLTQYVLGIRHAF